MKRSDQIYNLKQSINSNIKWIWAHIVGFFGFGYKKPKKSGNFLSPREQFWRVWGEFRQEQYFKNPPPPPVMPVKRRIKSNNHGKKETGAKEASAKTKT